MGLQYQSTENYLEYSYPKYARSRMMNNQCMNVYVLPYSLPRHYLNDNISSLSFHLLPMV